MTPQDVDAVVKRANAAGHDSLAAYAVALEEAMRLAVRELGPSPPLSAFGIAREDCALAHIDYFASIDVARYTLAEILGDIAAEPLACDCHGCVGEETAAEARERHRAAYTNVAAWKSEVGS